MNLLRTHRLFLFSPHWQRRMISRDHAVTSPSPLRHSWFSVHTGTKRYFSETSFLSLNNKAPSIAISNYDNDLQSPATESATLPLGSNEIFHHNRHPDIALDKFTHFALNSHTIPLGSMQEENWLDVLDAIDAWLNVGGGFAADSAERLLERLMNEHAASFSKKKSKLASSYSHRSMILADLQRDVLNTWIQVFHLSEGNSQLAISRAEQALFRLLNSLTIIDKATIQSPFPIKEYITIVEGYLHPHNQHEQGVKKAGTLLLRLTSNDNDKWDVDIGDHCTLITPIYEKCATQLLTIDSTSTLVTQLLKRMTVLKQSRICPDMKIPDTTERIILNAPLYHAGNSEKAAISAMSPFEVEVAENYLFDVLKNATEDQKNTIHGLVQKLTTTKPRNDVIVALLEYYVKIGDSESA